MLIKKQSKSFEKHMICILSKAYEWGSEGRDINEN